MPSHDVLFERMPARPRLLLECLLVITLFFLPAALLVMPSAALWYALGAGFVGWGAWALALTYRRPLAALAAVAGVATMLWSATVRAPQARPRLGIQPRDRDGCAEVTRTIAGTPADGRLQSGDCIDAVAGAPLDRAAPLGRPVLAAAGRDQAAPRPHATDGHARPRVVGRRGHAGAGAAWPAAHRLRLALAHPALAGGARAGGRAADG
jgi:membrane protein implicated in regulation of membrane protease activity